jgi:hypothetical protein
MMPFAYKPAAAVARQNRCMNCRPHCAACCIAPSISSAIPGMPAGKPAGVPCVQLDPDRRCRLFGRPERPAVCLSLRPQLPMCGHSPRAALRRLQALEAATHPGATQHG